MLKILEFVEAGEYETAWSLALASGREESLLKAVDSIANETSLSEIKAYNFYIDIKRTYSTDKYFDKIPFHDLTIGDCQQIMYVVGSKIFDKAQNFTKAQNFIKRKHYEKSNQ